MDRRKFLPLAGAGLATGYAAIHRGQEKPSGPRTASSVAILKAASYEQDLLDHIIRGLSECGLRVKGKNVLLKPNLVEFSADTCINTDPRVVAAAVEAFERLGAAEVIIGEGPGHRRDTLDVAEQASYFSAIPQFERRFVDLNRDDVSFVKHFVDSSGIYLANTAVRADLIVSMPKLKTHHWSGVTASMKNYFGVVPGAVYGWPKNQLHFFGITPSILALNRILGRKSFAIVDGIVGMEGNGPIQGTPKHCGVLIFGSDLVAVDASCCRVMGVDPNGLSYLTGAADGNLATEWIEQRGERIENVSQNFALIKEFAHLRKS
ncbi:MAG TPA: DUF362 domain-containing protein [Bryobacteraceae bacterium]|nr:DUF362 domain-containing protein [Bryobacteraceae bacterium]